MKCRFPLFALFLTGFFLFGGLSTAMAQDDGESYEAPSESSFNAPFSAGTFDLTLTAGLDTIFTPYIEPGADFGILNLGDGITLSIGGSLHGSYCIVCELSRFLPVRLSAWYVNPSLRAAAHFNMVGEALNSESLDLYAGLIAGSGYYRFRICFEDIADGRVNRFTALLGPYGGVRYTFSENRGFFVSLDARLLIEFGVTNSRVELAGYNEGEVYDSIETVSRGGLDLSLGLGFRF